MEEAKEEKRGEWVAIQNDPLKDFAKKFFSDWTKENFMSLFKDTTTDLSIIVEPLSEAIQGAVARWFIDIGRPDIASAFLTDEAREWLKRRLIYGFRGRAKQ